MSIAKTPVKETPGVRVTIFTSQAKCASLIAIPRKEKPDQFVTDELRFYMKLEGLQYIKLCTPNTLS